MAHPSFTEDHNHYFPHGCILCEIIHRLSALEGVVNNMSQAWDDQRERLTSYVSELRTRFDSLNSQVQQLSEQVQNAPDVDSAVAEQAARDAEEFKNQLDQLDQAFDLQEPSSGGGSTPDAGGNAGGGVPGGETGGGEGGPQVDNTLPGDLPGAETPQEPTAGPGGEVSAGGEVTTPDPGVGGTPAPGEPDQGGGEVAPGGPSPEPPQVDPNDPNAQQPTASPESPGADPTQPVPGSEGT
jgi:outer membrane murein-binding lipoprotein Lpp